MATIDRKIIESLKGDSETKGQKIDNLESGLKRTEFYMIGIAVVSAFGFITLLLTGWAFFADSLHFKEATYQSLIDKVNDVNRKIDTQNEFFYKNQIDTLQIQITDLKQNNPYLK